VRHLGHRFGSTWSGYGGGLYEEGLYGAGVGCSTFGYPQTYRGWQPGCS
jgi:hypothetical protein